MRDSEPLLPFIQRMFHLDPQLYVAVTYASLDRCFPTERILRRLGAYAEFIVLLEKRLRMKGELLHYMIARLSLSPPTRDIWDFLIESDLQIMKWVEKVIEDLQTQVEMMMICEICGASLDVADTDLEPGLYEEVLICEDCHGNSPFLKAPHPCSKRFEGKIIQVRKRHELKKDNGLSR
jgi:hypothetical protein